MLQQNILAEIFLTRNHLTRDHLKNVVHMSGGKEFITFYVHLTIHWFFKIC